MKKLIILTLVLGTLASCGKDSKSGKASSLTSSFTAGTSCPDLNGSYVAQDYSDMDSISMVKNSDGSYAMTTEDGTILIDGKNHQIPNAPGETYSAGCSANSVTFTLYRGNSKTGSVVYSISNNVLTVTASGEENYQDVYVRN